MKILLVENTPTKVITNFGNDFEVKSVKDTKWLGKKNGELLGLKASDNFDFLILPDKNLQHQQNLGKFDLTILLLHAKNNKHQNIQPFIERVKELLLRKTYKKFNDVYLYYIFNIQERITLLKIIDRGKPLSLNNFYPCS